MRVLLLVFLSMSYLIYCGNAEQKKIRPSDCDGCEREADPNDPRFEVLAKDSFRKYQEIHKGPYGIKSLRVTRATTQLVNGEIIRLNFEVDVYAKSWEYLCHSEIYEQPWKNVKEIDVKCIYGADAKPTSRQSPRSKTEDIGNDAVKEYLESKYKNAFFDRSVTKSIKRVTTRVPKLKITYYEVEAITHTADGDYSIFHCSVLTGSWFGQKPFATNCVKKNFLLGRVEWVDPTNEKYLSFAEEALQMHLKNSSELITVAPRDYRKYNIIVTFVTQGLVEGHIDNIQFIARWIQARDDDPTVLECSLKVWEMLNGETKNQGQECAIVSWNRDRLRRQ